MIPDGSGQASLFPPSLDLGADQVRGEGACRHPIGRRRAARPAPASRRPRRQDLARTVEALRATIEAQSATIVDIGAALERLDAEVRVAAGERRKTNEKLDALLRSQTETRRQLGQVELHRFPRGMNRQQPLGHD